MQEENRSSIGEVLRTRLEGIGRVLAEIDPAGAERLIELILRADRVFVTGKGRSGRIADCFAMRLMQMGFETHVPGEATCPRIQEEDLMVAISCSGQTNSTVQFAAISREAGAEVVGITAAAESPLTETADHVILVPVAGSEVRERFRYVLGPYNNTLFEESLLLYFDAVVYAILQREGISVSDLDQRHTNLE